MKFIPVENLLFIQLLHGGKQLHLINDAVPVEKSHPNDEYEDRGDPLVFQKMRYL
jgi:hypothetical protein